MGLLIIHFGYLYSAPSRNLLRGAFSPATSKEKCHKKLAEGRHIVIPSLDVVVHPWHAIATWGVRGKISMRALTEVYNPYLNSLQTKIET